MASWHFRNSNKELVGGGISYGAQFSRSQYQNYQYLIPCAGVSRLKMKVRRKGILLIAFLSCSRERDYFHYFFWSPITHVPRVSWAVVGVFDGVWEIVRSNVFLGTRRVLVSLALMVTQQRTNTGTRIEDPRYRPSSKEPATSTTKEPDYDT